MGAGAKEVGRGEGVKGSWVPLVTGLASIACAKAIVFGGRMALAHVDVRRLQLKRRNALISPSIFDGRVQQSKQTIRISASWIGKRAHALFSGSLGHRSL